MATLMSLVNPIRSLTPKYLLKPRLYPLRPSSFHFRHRSHPHLRRHTVAASFSDQSPSSSTIDNNPLLQDFLFPPFDVIDASHVRPGMRALLNKLVCFIVFLLIVLLSGYNVYVYSFGSFTALIVFYEFVLS